MNVQNHNDLVPRPSPKPSQIELPVIPSRPEIPEVSLLFDSNIRKSEAVRPQISENRNDENALRNCMIADKSHLLDFIQEKPSSNVDTMHEFNETRKCSTSCTPRSTKRRDDFYNHPKHVSFSSPMSHSNLHDFSSMPSYSQESDRSHQLNSNKEHSNYCCGFNSESYRLSGHPSSPLSCADYSNSNQYLNPGYDGNKKSYARNHHSRFTPCSKYYESNYDRSMNNYQSYITLDEYQKMVSEFTKIIANLNSRFDQIADNFIPRDEVDQITKKLEFRVESLTQRVNELTSKLEAENESKSHHVNEYGECRPVDDRAKLNFEVKSKEKHPSSGQDPWQCTKTPLVTCERYEKEYDVRQSMIQAPVQGAVNMDLRSSNVRDHEFTDQRHISDKNLCQDQVIRGRQSSRGENTVDPAFENANKRDSANNRMLGVVEQNNILGKNLESSQFERIYHNIVRDVKNMIDMNSPVSDDRDQMDFIKKATLEQLRVLGISVGELQQTEQQQQYQLNENYKSTSNDLIASSDMSELMNSLAKKYISDGESDFTKREWRQGNDVNIRSNFNNLSVATLQYMQHYHLLSVMDDNSAQSAGVSKPRSSNKFNYHELRGSNDRSFVR